MQGSITDESNRSLVLIDKMYK